MDRALRKWDKTSSLGLDEERLQRIIKKLSRTYTLYGSMLLLPPDSIDNLELQDVWRPQGQESERHLLSLIAREMKVTHIAINRPIPPQNEQAQDLDNITRAPLNFQPIYGDFGPASCASTPSIQDFEQAYWVTAKQNGISQTWSPRWTMFSRGNISEKARVLSLPSVQQAIAEGQEDATGCCAVDLYAGIGYFTFSYIKAGVSKVLCWELNNWSCEGLRRGARANKWRSATYDGTSLSELAAGHEQVIIFNETNEMAPERIDGMRAYVPPIRHVNCGLLPTSRPSYPVAFAALDPVLGGWVHVHENFGVSEIEERASEVRAAFQSYLDNNEASTRVAVLESINRVKTYAPGVFHCVLDIYIPPSQKPD